MLAITHNGIFHADEVAGNAVIMKWNNFKYLKVLNNLNINDEFITRNYMFNEETLYIYRTRNQKIINWGLKNINVIVIDNGGIYNSKMLNFDHHQNKDMQASNILVFKHLFAEDKIEQDVYEAILPFMEGISNHDTNKDNLCNKWASYNSDHKLRNMSNIISGFNRDPRNEELQNKQFKLAVEFALQILDNEEYSAVQRIEAEAIYENREVLSNNIAVFNKFCPIWKTKEEHNYAILPNPQGWSLNSANSNINPLPNIEHKDLIFAHKGLFIAVFSTKEAAIEVALTL